MATQADVRRIAMKLPGTVEAATDFAFSAPGKDRKGGYAWVWKERVDPKKARVPQPKVLAIRTANLAEKDLILQSDPVKFFTEPHYNGYPAVLVRLAEVTAADLKVLLEGAWKAVATKALPGDAAGATSAARRTRRAGARSRRR